MNDHARPASEVSVMPYRQRIIERYTVNYVRAFEHGAITAGGGVAVVMGCLLMMALGCSGLQTGLASGAGLLLWMVAVIRVGGGMASGERTEFERAFGHMAGFVAEMISGEDAQSLHTDLLSNNNFLSANERRFAWEVLIRKGVVPRGPFY